MASKTWLKAGMLALFLVALSLRGLSAQELPEPKLGRMEGEVINLTAGGERATGITVDLIALEEFQPVERFTSTVDSDGIFVFDQVPLVEGYTYITTLEYQGVAYGSSYLAYEGVGDVFQMDIEIYEASAEPVGISVNNLHVVVDFGEGAIWISELYLFDNLSDLVYTGSLDLILPEGVTKANVYRSMGDSIVPATESVIRTSDGFRDTLPVRPGQTTQELILEFALPYEGEATVSHPVIYPVKTVSLFLPDVGLTLESDLMIKEGRPGGEAMPYVQWKGEDLVAGESFSFKVSGKPDMSGMTESVDSVRETAVSPLSVQAGDNPVTWAVAAGGLGLMALIVVISRGQRRGAPDREKREALLEAIVELDVAHDAGKIPDVRYELQRERLKAELHARYRE